MERRLNAPLGLGDHVRVVDTHHAAAGQLGTIIACDDAGRYFVHLDADPTPNHDQFYHASQLALEQSANGHGISGAM